MTDNKKSIYAIQHMISTAFEYCALTHTHPYNGFFPTIVTSTHAHGFLALGNFFFYFLVYGSSDPKFCILEKNKKFIFDFFLLSPM